MSQNDFIIANQTFPNFRIDLNDALQALASSSSGSVAPTTTYAHMLWYDTANDILKMRTSADDGWINLMNFDQGTDTATASLVEVDNTNTLNTNSTTVPPSVSAVKTYVGNRATTVNLGSLASGPTSAAHGMTPTPTEVSFYIQCTSADAGFSVGDRVFNVTAQSQADSNDAFTVWVNSTNVGFSLVGDIRVATKTGTYVAITKTSWDVYATVRAD